MEKLPYFHQLNQCYWIDFSVYSIERFGEGHIHQTWLAKSDSDAWIIQHFNKCVFQDPCKIAQNHQLLINLLEFDKLNFQLPLPIPDLEGNTLCLINGEYFRVLPFVTGECFQAINDSSHGLLAARAFASLIDVASGLDVTLFQEVIPGFHDLTLRYRQFEDAVASTKIEIEGDLCKLIRFYQSKFELVTEYQRWIKVLPKRITHNDTKINNLIFHTDLSNIAAIIDLDTMMPGYVFNDFGDLVRTVTCTLDENSTAFEQISVDVDNYKAVYEGFLAGGSFMTEAERTSLHFGGEMMTYIMGLRFLTDHLNGNVYYHTRYEKQNFDRATNQMHLLIALINCGFRKDNLSIK
ncbi:phosphotransferase enzyme family protein [Belliella kenyensis]|uniref:Phosphotransferase enzyme family protein n=1 Tax=Belliella kenyensis TaxID=1472724 RepID=A0ABV8ENL4_9BACT|nr:aminoglycoside phosphotransferase family protein [Belliella kenyensis]MCH7401552.1 aminoglycoside phosphotransferase family protein [Belliella kenyensis]MDN3603168.1 aminoglycoside phosphotransferase family protein [Belliella kenyensis]